jgi:hypothetical protein
MLDHISHDLVLKSSGDFSQPRQQQLLASARRALVQNEDNITVLDELQRHAEAIRLAAKQLGIATPGINAWTRFKIDVNRTAARRIDAGQLAGEIAVPGDNQWSLAGATTTLTALIGKNARRRAYDWARQAMVPEARLDEVFAAADQRLILVTEKEITRLGADIEAAATRAMNGGTIVPAVNPSINRLVTAATSFMRAPGLVPACRAFSSIIRRSIWSSSMSPTKIGIERSQPQRGDDLRYNCPQGRPSDRLDVACRCGPQEAEQHRDAVGPAHAAVDANGAH